MSHSRLDDEDYPAITMGQAAEMLGVQPAFLRSLDAGGVLQPARTGGGHRRYSRRQLRRAARLRELFDEGHTLAAAHRIVSLEEELSASDDRLRAAAADLDLRTDERDSARADLDHRADELAAAQRELEVARGRIAALDRALQARSEATGSTGSPAEEPEQAPAGPGSRAGQERRVRAPRAG
jgi:MerR family transcriptional regulator, heat shock protein HspR